MKKEYGYNSYCSLFGEHKSDPCPCGWSSKKDFCEFYQDLVYYTRLMAKETGKKNPTLKSLSSWVWGKF